MSVLNFYVYTKGDPVNFVDRTGLAPGDPFKTADAAAVDALKYIYDYSRFFGVEMGGYIYKDEECYYAQIPTFGSIYGINLGKKLKNTVASYHSHPNSEGNFSEQDEQTIRKDQINGYLINSVGDIIKYIYSTIHEESGVLWLDNIDGEGPIPNFDYYRR